MVVGDVGDVRDGGWRFAVGVGGGRGVRVDVVACRGVPGKADYHQMVRTLDSGARARWGLIITMSEVGEGVEESEEVCSDRRRITGAK